MFRILLLIVILMIAAWPAAASSVDCPHGDAMAHPTTSDVFARTAVVLLGTNADLGSTFMLEDCSLHGFVSSCCVGCVSKLFILMPPVSAMLYAQPFDYGLLAFSSPVGVVMRPLDPPPRFA